MAIKKIKINPIPIKDLPMHARLGIIMFAAAILDIKLVKKQAETPAVTVKA